MARKFKDNSVTGAGSRSITSHPIFPAIVALWFTVLLGIGSLLLPVVLFERLLEISGLASLVPAVAPPFGITARLVIAIACGIAGAALGRSVARRVVGASSDDEPYAQAPVVSKADAGAGESAVHRPRRRRALAVADLGPPLAEIPADPEPQRDYIPVFADTPEHEVEAPVIDIPEPEPQVVEWQRAEETVSAAEFFAAHDAIELPAEVVEDPIEELEALEEAPEPTLEAEAVPVERSSADLDDLDINQLVERFSATVVRRREWLATRRHAKPAPAQPAVATPAETTLVSDSPVPLTEETPAIQRPPFFDWVEHLNAEGVNETATPGFSIPMHSAAFMSPAIEPEYEEIEAEEEVEGETDDAYGSLIEMKNPFAPPRSDFIRMDEGEANPERGFDRADDWEEPQERPDNGPDTVNAEASLRAALAKLQQLSGNP